MIIKLVAHFKQSRPNMRRTLHFICAFLFFGDALAFDEEDAEKVREFMNGLNECRGIPGNSLSI